MPEEINLEKIKKEYPEFYANFPKELLEIALLEDTSLQIAEICVESGVTEEAKIEDISYHITSVLMGRLSPELLPRALQTNSKIDTATAEKIYTEVDRRIFSPVKDVLTKIYGETPAETQKQAVSPEKLEEKKPQKSSSKDVYREIIE